jgi:excisionase family DNA binding protein
MKFTVNMEKIGDVYHIELPVDATERMTREEAEHNKPIKELLTYREAAGILTVSEAQVKRMAYDGTFKIIKIGHSARLNHLEILAYLRQVGKQNGRG